MKFLSLRISRSGPFFKTVSYNIIFFGCRRFVNSKVINCRQYIPLKGAECTFAVIEQQVHFTCSFYVRLCHMYMNNIISLQIGEGFHSVVCCCFFFPPLDSNSSGQYFQC